MSIGTFSPRNRQFFPAFQGIFRIDYFLLAAYINLKINRQIRLGKRKGDKTMARYHGGKWVKAGFYWSPARWEIITIPKGGRALPGGEELSYFRVPVLFILVLGPLMGAVYVIFLPLIGFGLFFGFAGKKLFLFFRRAVKGVIEKLAALREEEG
jgi:hypothetical protein